MTALALTLALTALPPAGGEAPPASLADTLLAAAPKQCVLAFSLRDLDGLRERASAHAWGRFLADPEMEKIGQWLASKGITWEAAMADSDLPVDPLEFLGSIHDSMLVFMAPVGPDLEPGFGILIAPGEERGDFEDHLDAVLASMEDELTSSSDTYQDVDLSLFDSPDPDEPDLVVFETGGVAALVGSTGSDPALELAHEVVDGLAGRNEDGGLAELAALADARKTVGGARSVEFLVDVGSMIKLVSAHEEDWDEEVQSLLDDIGVGRMRWVYLNADLGQGEELDLGFSLHVPEDSYMARYFDLFRPVPRDMARYLPPSSASISLGSFDLWGAWQTTLEILDERAPELGRQLQAGLEMVSSSTGLDIEQDLLAQIDGTIAGFTMTVPEEEVRQAMGPMAQMGVDVEGFDQGNATIIGLKDPEVVELFLEDVLSMVNVSAMVEQEDYQGEVVSSMAMPGMGGLHWTFTDGALIFSEYPTALHAALSMLSQEEPQTALAVSPFKERLKGNLGASIVSVSDTAESVRAILAVGGMLTQLFGSMDLGPGAPSLAGIPKPDPSIAAKYFEGTLLGKLTRRSDSFTIELSGR